MLFPLLAFEESLNNDISLTVTETTGGVKCYTGYIVETPREILIENALCLGGTITETVTQTVTLEPATVTSTLTSIDDTPLLPELTLQCTPKSQSSVCDAKHSAWGAGYLMSAFINLFYCDKFPVENHYFKHMSCNVGSQIGLGFSLGAINNMLSSCKDTKIMDISAIEGTSFVGLGTATYFKLYGCLRFSENNGNLDSLSKCNEIADHAINVFSSVGSLVINS